jgi:uncharacterized protein with PQ loop repeat
LNIKNVVGTICKWLAYGAFLIAVSLIFKVYREPLVILAVLFFCFLAIIFWAVKSVLLKEKAHLKTSNSDAGKK